MEKSDMVKHLTQVENSLETIERYLENKDVPRTDIEWTSVLRRSLRKARDMFKVIIYLYDKDENDFGLTDEEKATLAQIELACTKTVNNWKMPLQLRAKYFAGQEAVLDYRKSLRSLEVLEEVQSESDKVVEIS